MGFENTHTHTHAHKTLLQNEITMCIQVINAQKLGALAVIIVNVDEGKSMRLNALPDEVPQINIPSIMVSRKFSSHIEKHLSPYFLIDQHVVSFQPTGVHGGYDD